MFYSRKPNKKRMMKSICSRTLMMKFDSVGMSSINLNVIAYVNMLT